MAPKTVFRVIVVMAFAFSLAGILTDAYPIEGPEEWDAVLEWSGNGGIWDSLLHVPSQTGQGRFVLIPILATVFVFVIAVEVGMLLFWRFARACYVWLTVASVALIPFSGLIVMVPLDAVFSDLAVLLNGAVIAMSYLHPIAREFEAKRAYPER